jgi:uncharacterized membrane protein
MTHEEANTPKGDRVSSPGLDSIVTEEGTDMRNTTVVVAAYRDLPTAEADWNALERLAKEGLYVSDAALVTKDAEGNPKTLERQSHHGWGKGAVAGAVVGVLFPPALIGATVAGGVAGGVTARLTRSLGRGKVHDLGEVLDRGEIALVTVVDTGSLVALKNALVKAVDVHSEDTGLTDDDLKQAATA